ncbi:MAG: hypothetical protein ABW352_16710 [Polyangiales bacterium]
MNQNPPETDALLETLTREFFQTETSVTRRSRREASRLGGVPPARALLQIAAHANEVLDTFPAIARHHGLPESAPGSVIGALFASVDRLGELLVDNERSYRGTLLGVRHGLDLARLMRHATYETSDLLLAEFLDAWLATRVVLVENLEEELIWFAKNPHFARKNAPLSLRMVISRSARV